MTLCFHWTFNAFSSFSLFSSLTHSLAHAISFSLSFSTTNRNGHCYWVTYSILIPSDYKRFYNYYYYPTYIATHHTARCYINANNNSRKSGAMISFSIFRLLFYIISDHQICFCALTFDLTLRTITINLHFFTLRISIFCCVSVCCFVSALNSIEGTRIHCFLRLSINKRQIGNGKNVKKKLEFKFFEYASLSLSLSIFTLFSFWFSPLLGLSSYSIRWYETQNIGFRVARYKLHNMLINHIYLVRMHFV